MQLIAAPARQFRTWSMWLVIATGVGDLALVLTNTLSSDGIISAQTLAVSNAVLMFIVGCVRLVQQQIPFSTEEKVDALTAVAQQPMKAGEDDVVVHVDGEKVSR